MTKSSQSRKTVNVLIISGVVGFIILSLWGYKPIPWQKKTIDLGYSPQARSNPFLAAELFLERTGLPVESIRGLEKFESLPSTDTTLVISSWRLSMGEKRVQEVLDWIRKGGHLITTAQTDFDPDQPVSPDKLLDEFGVRRVTDRSFFEKVDSSQGLSTSDSADTPFLTKVNFTDLEEPLKIHFTENIHLEDTTNKASASAACNNQVKLLQYEFGQGLLTVFADDLFLQNPAIEDHDHAHLLWSLTENSSKVWFIYHGVTPSLLKLLAKHASTVLISGIVLLLLWVWSQGIRIGPILPAPPVARRQLMEHILANSNYLWRYKKMDSLLKNLWADIEDALWKRHKDYHDFSDTQKANLIQTLTQIPPDHIKKLIEIFSHPDRHQAEFYQQSNLLQIIQSLQRIRKQI